MQFCPLTRLLSHLARCCVPVDRSQATSQGLSRKLLAAGRRYSVTCRVTGRRRVTQYRHSKEIAPEGQSIETSQMGNVQINTWSDRVKVIASVMRCVCACTRPPQMLWCAWIPSISLMARWRWRMMRFRAGGHIISCLLTSWWTGATITIAILPLWSSTVQMENCCAVLQLTCPLLNKHDATCNAKTPSKCTMRSFASLDDFEGFIINSG